MTDFETHAYLGKPEEASSSIPGGPNAQCQRNGCGKLRLAKVHAGHKPEYLPAAPQTVQVAGFYNESEMEPPRIDTLGITPMGVVAQAIDIIPAVQAWDALSAQVRDTIVRKSQGYGNAWQEQGYMGNIARVLSKQSRIRNLVWCEPKPDFKDQETVEDTLVDLAALCAFAIANMQDGNQWGR